MQCNIPLRHIYDLLGFTGYGEIIGNQEKEFGMFTVFYRDIHGHYRAYYSHAATAALAISDCRSDCSVRKILTTREGI